MISSLFFVFGVIVFAFIPLQSILSITFGIPFTLKLEKKGLLKNNNGIIKRFFCTVLITTSLFIVILLLLKTFAPISGFRGFIGGCVLSLIISIPKLFTNKNNIDDYMLLNRKHFKDEEKI